MSTENTINIEQHIFDCAPGAVVNISGKEYSYFGGTGYYELNKSKQVIDAAIEALKKYGVTSSSSRSSYGTTELILELEKEAADYFDCEDSVYLPSGFLTDAAAINALNKKGLFDIVFIDEISHYSNQHAAVLSGKPVVKFSHLDYNELDEKLSSAKDKKPLVISDGVFPVSGKIAPVNFYTDIILKYNGIIWIDDAHAIGILGKNGRGTFEYYNLKSDNLFFGGTLSKAFGGFGGIIPGKKDFINEIKNNHIINGSTPPPSSAAAASLMGFRLLKSKPDMRTKLLENARRLKSGLKKIGIEIDGSPIPVAAFKLDSKKEMLKIKNELMNKNILIQFIDYIGSGNDGTLRIVVFSTHTFEQIDNLIYQLKKII